jgi:hypothetical protein
MSQCNDHCRVLSDKLACLQCCIHRTPVPALQVVHNCVQLLCNPLRCLFTHLAVALVAPATHDTASLLEQIACSSTVSSVITLLALLLQQQWTPASLSLSSKCLTQSINCSGLRCSCMHGVSTSSRCCIRQAAQATARAAGAECKC